jgi:hypothetical protein
MSLRILIAAVLMTRSQPAVIRVGRGNDVSRAGDKIEGAAERNR